MKHRHASFNKFHALACNLGALAILALGFWGFFHIVSEFGCWERELIKTATQEG
tara:strand:+ start:494 stop:655 length:162 start_codon:yes stop_codon:yes gene_type:complete